MVQRLVRINCRRGGVQCFGWASNYKETEWAQINDQSPEAHSFVQNFSYLDISLSELCWFVFWWSLGSSLMDFHWRLLNNFQSILVALNWTCSSHQWKVLLWMFINEAENAKTVSQLIDYRTCNWPFSTLPRIATFKPNADCARSKPFKLFQVSINQNLRMMKLPENVHRFSETSATHRSCSFYILAHHQITAAESLAGSNN